LEKVAGAIHLQDEREGKLAAARGGRGGGRGSSSLVRGGREDEEVEGEGPPVNFSLAREPKLTEDMLHLQLDG